MKMLKYESYDEYMGYIECPLCGEEECTCDESQGRMICNCEGE